MDQKTKDLIHLLEKGVSSEVISRLIDTKNVSEEDLIAQCKKNHTLDRLISSHLFCKNSLVDLGRAAAGAVGYQNMLPFTLDFFEEISKTPIQKEDIKAVNFFIGYLVNPYRSHAPASLWAILDWAVDDPDAIPVLFEDIRNAWKQNTVKKTSLEFIAAAEKVEKITEIISGISVNPEKPELANFFDKNPDYQSVLQSSRFEESMELFLRQAMRHKFLKTADRLNSFFGDFRGFACATPDHFLFALVDNLNMGTSGELTKNDFKNAVSLLTKENRDIFFSQLVMFLPFSQDQSGKSPAVHQGLLELVKEMDIKLTDVPLNLENDQVFFYEDVFEVLSNITDEGFKYAPEWFGKIMLISTIQTSTPKKILQKDSFWSWFLEHEDMLPEKTKGFFNLARQASSAPDLFDKSELPDMTFVPTPANSDLDDTDGFYRDLYKSFLVAKQKSVLKDAVNSSGKVTSENTAPQPKRKI